MKALPVTALLFALSFIPAAFAAGDDVGVPKNGVVVGGCVPKTAGKTCCETAKATWTGKGCNVTRVYFYGTEVPTMTNCTLYTSNCYSASVGEACPAGHTTIPNSPYTNVCKKDSLSQPTVVQPTTKVIKK